MAKRKAKYNWRKKWTAAVRDKPSLYGGNAKEERAFPFFKNITAVTFIMGLDPTQITHEKEKKKCIRSEGSLNMFESGRWLQYHFQEKCQMPILFLAF